MRFYQKEHKYYCGIDLHARAMYVCIVNRKGKILYHENLGTSPEILFNIIFPYLGDVVVCVECMFCWYWIADFCREHHIPFVLAYALYLKAIHGGKTKNDKIDSRKIAMLLRGGNIPMAYAYPKERRAIRDLLRRRMHLMRKRSELLSHIVNTNSQYNLPPFPKKIAYKGNRNGIAERFADPYVQKSIELDLGVIDTYDRQIREVEHYIEKHAKTGDPTALYRLKTIPGVGQILSLVLLYEIDDITRFPTVQDFASYARLIRPQKVSDGKWAGKSNKKIGNAHLKWAISEIAIIMLRESERIKQLVARLEKRHGKGKALGIFSHKIGRAIYFMLKKGSNPLLTCFVCDG